MYYTVCFSFSMIFSFLSILHVLQWVFPFFHVFQCFCHISLTTMCVFHFPWFSVFSSYSRSYSVHFSFSIFSSVSSHIPGQTVFLSHFPRLSGFSPYSRSNSVHFKIFTFYMSLTIFQVRDCVVLIVHDFQYSCHTQGPTLCIPNFSRFSMFLAIFHFLQYVFLIFHDFQCSHHSPVPRSVHF